MPGFMPGFLLPAHGQPFLAKALDQDRRNSLHHAVAERDAIRRSATHDDERDTYLLSPISMAVPDTGMPASMVAKDRIQQAARTVDLPLRFGERIHSDMIRAFTR